LSLDVIVCIDYAYACDPRIAQFKLDEKERKQAGKRAKQEAVKQKAEEEERVCYLYSSFTSNESKPQQTLQ